MCILLVTVITILAFDLGFRYALHRQELKELKKKNTSGE